MHLTAAEILETLMIISFGISWPTSIHKSYTARSTKGKSLLFLFFIFVGYLFGIAAKLLTNNLNLAFWFYILNSVIYNSYSGIVTSTANTNNLTFYNIFFIFKHVFSAFLLQL